MNTSEKQSTWLMRFLVTTLVGILLAGQGAYAAAMRQADEELRADLKASQAQVELLKTQFALQQQQLNVINGKLDLLLDKK